MPQRVQTLRTSTKNQRPAVGSREPGELYVSFPDLQIGVIDAARNPQDLVAVRYFSAATNYAPGDFVIQGGQLLKALVPVVSSPFDPLEWKVMGEVTDAPSDGKSYVRKDAGWTEGITKATFDSTNVSQDARDDAQDVLIALKAPINSPGFTGNPTAPTPPPGDNDTSVATTAFVTGGLNTYAAAQDGRDDAQDTAIAARLTDAPSDGYIYGRRSADWARVLAGAGALGDYVFENLTTVPPSNGCVRLDSATQNNATLLYITYLDHGTTDRKPFIINTIKPGVTLYLQDPNAPTRWQLYKVTDVLTDLSTYASIPVQWLGGGTASLATGTNLSVDVLGSAGAGVSVSDAPPAAPQPGQLWWESDSGALYIYYEDANTRQFVQINGSNAYPSGMQRVTALSRNRIVNGAFQISQENPKNTAYTAVNIYPADQWTVYWITTGAPATACQQYHPDDSGDSNWWVRMSSAAGADTSIAAGEYLTMRQPIEGNRLADFRWGTAYAKPAVLRFKAWSNYAGTFCVAIRSGTRAFVKNCTIAANTFTEFVIPIPASTTGTWPTDNNAGLSLNFTVMAGSTFTGGVDNQWVDASWIATPQISNWLSAVNQVLDITNVGLYLDPDNTGLAPPWQMPDEAEELAACQRYWQKLGDAAVQAVGAGIQYSTTQAQLHVPYLAQMRSIPAVTMPASSLALRTVGAAATVTSITPYPGLTSMLVDAVTTGLTAGHGTVARILNNNAPAFLLNARM